MSNGMVSLSLSSMMSTMMSPDFLFCDLGSSIIGKVKLGLFFLLGGFGSPEGFGNLEGFGNPSGLGNPGEVLTPPSMSGDSKHASDDQYLPSLSDQVTSS